MVVGFAMDFCACLIYLFEMINVLMRMNRLSDLVTV